MRILLAGLVPPASMTVKSARDMAVRPYGQSDVNADDRQACMSGDERNAAEKRAANRS
jgi:hypothetical protein